MRSLLRSKIHGATVTHAEVEYVGSIEIDRELMDRVDLWPGERVLVSDMDNGSRFETYVLVGRPGSGTIGVNGAAARLVEVGHRLIIMGFELTDGVIQPRVIFVDERNRFLREL